MGDYEKVDASFEVRKVPDVLTPTQQASSNPPELGAGFYEFGAVIGGVFVPIHVRKAAGLDADIARYSESPSSSPQSSPQPEPESPLGEPPPETPQ